MDRLCVSRLVARALLPTAVALSLAGPVASAAAEADPLLGQQWALSDVDAIGVPQAWQSSTGAGVVVAVLDTGVQLDHPDLAGAIWRNADEVPGNGRDDDRNGYVDDVNGVNMFDGSPNVNDDEGHGTHVAGIVAARRGNGAGGAGVAPEAQVMPVKVLNSSRSGNTSVLSAGIRYALDEGAKIINVSINGNETSGQLAEAVRLAGERGATIIASAGNDGRDLDLAPSYPASLPDAGVLSVTATEIGGALWGLANRGLRSVDLAAPGSHIVSTATGGRYGLRSGTSAAAPHVSGALALLAAARPDLSQAALREALLGTARSGGPLAGLLGGGGLDIGAAMARVGGGRALRSAPGAASSARVRLRAGRSRAGRRATLRWSATGADQVTSWRVSLDGRVVGTVAADDRLVFQRRIRRAGRHAWRVVGFDDAEAKVVAARRGFTVTRRR